MKILTAQHRLAVSASIVLAASVCGAQIQYQIPQYTALERRTPHQMSADDAAVLTAHAGEVVRAAEFYSIDLEQGSWTYQQSVCPLMPRHLIVNYFRHENSGAETQFVAVVPRGTEPVRVVVVQRNGLAPFEPAETSANSAVTFNRVWAAEGGNLKAIESESNWITLGLCYAEMVGSHPLIVSANPLAERTAAQPTLRYVSNGGAAATFNDVGLPSQTWSWTLSFDRHGVLKSVDRQKLARNLKPLTTAQITAGMNPAPIPPHDAATPSLVPNSVTPPSGPGYQSNTAASSATVTPTMTASGNSSSAKGRDARILPDGEAPPGRIIPDTQEAPAGRIIPGPQELPPPSQK
jgi:hypothetical protein